MCRLDPSLFAETGDHMNPDGLCHWKSADGRDKIIVAVFDHRETSSDGFAIQFDATNGHLVPELTYAIPGSPRVTHPAIIQEGPGKPFWVYFTTANENLLQSRGDNVATSQVSALFRAPLPRDVWPTSLPVHPVFRLQD